MNCAFPALSYSTMCLRALLDGVPRDLLCAGGDTGDLIDATLARILGWGDRPRAMPFTRRVHQAAVRLRARLGGAE